MKIITIKINKLKTINYIFKYVNSDLTPEFYKFILKGRLRELITAKSFLIFLWGNSLELYTEAVYTENKFFLENKNTVFIKDKNTIEIWNLILDRLKEPSTYAGLSVIVLAFGVTSEQWETISTAIAAVAGLVSMILKERKQ